MAGWVLTMKERPWSPRTYVSRDNPSRVTEELGEAYRFHTRTQAICAKKGLLHDRRFAARQIPEWLS